MDTARLRPRQSLSPVWRRSPYLPPDLNGPADVPFDPPPANFTETPIFTLFEAAAARDHSACALVSGDAQISYGSLRRHALALAQRIDAVAPPDAPVAISLENPADAVVGLLAAMPPSAPTLRTPLVAAIARYGKLIGRSFFPR